MRWTANDEVLNVPPITIGASQTEAPISYVFPVGANPLVFKVNIVITAITVGGGITAKLQSHNGSTWVDVASVSITSTGVFVIKIHPYDGNDIVLDERVRVVCTTGIGSSVTISNVIMYRQEG